MGRRDQHRFEQLGKNRLDKRGGGAVVLLLPEFDANDCKPCGCIGMKRVELVAVIPLIGVEARRSST